MTPAAERFKELLCRDGFPYQVVSSSPAFARLIVQDNRGDEVLVDIGHDYRLQPAEPTHLGPVLAIEELAADKMLALFGRAEARDFVDVFMLCRKLGTGKVLAWAKQKDPGFDEHILAVMLGRLGRLARREFPVDDVTFDDMQAFFRELRAKLIDACLSP